MSITIIYLMALALLTKNLAYFVQIIDNFFSIKMKNIKF